MKKIISIVGCGAVGAAQLYHLIDQLIEIQCSTSFQIIVFEKNTDLGHGLAYAADDHSNLLNRSAEIMSLLYNKPDDFINWLINNKSKWQSLFPHIKIQKKKELFVPRALFGLYIEDTVQRTILKAKQHKIKVNIIHDEVINIIKTVNEGYELHTRNNWKLYADICILTVGNLPSNKFGKNNKNINFFTSPYPTTKLNHISASAKIGILGSSLSAIDTAIALKQKNHIGPMALISRNGLMPSIRAPHRSYKLKLLTDQFLKSIIDEGISLRQIIKLVQKEVGLSLGKKASFKCWFERPYDPIEYFENEFKNYKSKENIVWQSVLIAFNHAVEKIWNNLKETDKSIFFNFYKRKWMARRVGIPFGNAEIVYKLFKSKQLSLINNFNKIEEKNNNFLIKKENEIFIFDYIIDATGACDNIDYLDAPLIANLIDNGLIQSNSYGGVDIDFDTSRVINTSNSIEKNLYVIGNITSGVYFFTSVLELNSKHAFKIARKIISDFILDYSTHTVDSRTPYPHTMNQVENLYL